jgi:hypothetical protein
MENKLIEFQKKVTAIKKDGKNPHFKSNYATLSQILSEVKPLLSEIGLVLLQPIKDGKVYSVLVNDKNEVVFESYIDLPTGLTPQQIGSAITYYRRYTLASLLSLELEDDDGNAASEAKPDNRPWLNKGTDLYKQAAEHLKKGGKITDIEAKFKLSKEVRESLLADGI